MLRDKYAAVVAITLVFLACRESSQATGPDSPGPPESLGSIFAPDVGSGRYIVVFRDDVADPAGAARDLVTALGGSLLHTYTSAIKGFAALLPATALPALRANPLVASVEDDQVVRADGTESMDSNGDPWGLDRIDQRSLPLSATYTYTSTGAGVHAYIIDTGIWTAHPEFGGRADNAYDALGLTGERCGDGGRRGVRGGQGGLPPWRPSAHLCGAGVHVRRHCRRRLGQRKPSQSGRGQHVAGRRCFEFAEPGGDQSLELRGVRGGRRRKRRRRRL